MSAPAIAAAQKGAPPAALSMDIMHIQVILDHLGFSPGVIDGKPGQSLKLALRGFQSARGLSETGDMDRPTMAALANWRSIRPLRTLVVTQADAAGPFVGPLPDDMAEQAKLPTLGYADLSEKLAEKFHTTPATLAALNGGRFRPAAGAKLRFPNVLPQSRSYPEKLDANWRQTLSDLNVDARSPVAARIVVDKSEGALKVYDEDDRLVAQFPATMGSEHDPLPLGGWTIKGAAYNPPFHYNPALFWDADSNEGKARLPPGPNGPVGVVWLDISKEHYGIHGTPNPEKIGRTESHGCIRLTNWDAARLSLMVKPGTPALFRE
ncbi:L,D-transpeptidase [Sphingomonas sp. XMGL2]|uniref:L,D-transpeptidase n=2 Tax=Sphingomonas quercus TaxID=2842451 RepID=A0ABS6BLS1_9SPHN|nr:L,D-transpeptidase [Sphingomonas quercus]